MSKAVIEERARFWSYVTAFGALWGATEVTIGAFLHALRLPLVGVFLSCVGALILIAQRQVFPQRGASIATGVVAALLKSMSPGGIILGPMIGILSEAILIELALFTYPRGRILAFIAGALAPIWSISQGVVTKIVVYGWDFIALIEALLVRLAKSLGLGAEILWWAGAAIISGIALFGGLVGLLGHALGVEVRKEREKGAGIELDWGREGGSVFEDESRPALRSRRWLFPLAMLSLLLQFGPSLLWALGALVVFLVGLGLGSRDVLRALWWPKFWLVTIVLSLGAGWLLGGEADPVLGLPMGVVVGLRMLVRGAHFFALVSWGARAVRSQELVSVWAKIGVPEMGAALVRALRLLPLVISEQRLLEPQATKGWRGLKARLSASLVRAMWRAEAEDRVGDEEHQDHC